MNFGLKQEFATQAIYCNIVIKKHSVLSVMSAGLGRLVLSVIVLNVAITATSEKSFKFKK